MAKFLTAAEAKSRLAEFDVIIDVRTQKEWDDGHLQLPSVRHVENFHQHPEKVADVADASAKKVLVHCGIGKRAAMAGKILEATFTDLTVVTDGGYSSLV